MSTGQQRLTTEARLWLNLTLNALPKAQFDMLLFALNPPNGNIPGDAAAQSDRSAKLLEWAESPIGCGLLIVDKVLDQIIAAASGKADKYLALIISGKIRRSTPGQLQAVVELLRKKTEDDSMDIAFFQEGSIKVILNGSPEGLAKLQEVFEAGELLQLDIPPVEAVAPVDTNTQEARKARFIQVLKLRGRSVSTKRGIDRDRALDLSEADLGGANLSNVDLTGVDLTGADLTYADVTGTRFGRNSGLSKADKRDLKKRGAILRDNTVNGGMSKKDKLWDGNAP